MLVARILLPEKVPPMTGRGWETDLGETQVSISFSLHSSANDTSDKDAHKGGEKKEHARRLDYCSRRFPTTLLLEDPPRSMHAMGTPPSICPRHGDMSLLVSLKTQT